LWPRLLPYLGPILFIAVARTVLPASILDDAYISFRVAQNLAAGNGMVFNLGEAAYVSTSPLWVILLAAFRSVTGDVVLAAAVLGTFFEMLAAVSLVWLGTSLRQGVAVGVIAALLLCTNPVFLLSSFGGMETSLYLYLLCLSLGLLVRERFLLAATVAALAVWARFDGLLLYGMVVAWILHAQRGDLLRRPLRVLRGYLPSLAVLAAYFLFGYLVFGDPLPMSVQRKTAGLAPLLSAEWFTGATVLLRRFLQAILDTSGFWFSRNALLVLLGIPLLLGAVRCIREKEISFLPVGAFSLLYVLSLVGSGSGTSVFWVWYFAPVLPGAYLLVAKGWVWLVSIVTEQVRPLRVLRQRGPALAVFVVVWSVFMLIGPLKREAGGLALSVDGNAGREQYYAAAAVWAGNHLPGGSSIAAIEIGALGFFLPPEIKVLDIYGILRRKEDSGADYLELIQRDRPELVLVLERFDSREEIEGASPGMYVWERFDRLDIGVRADLHPELAERLGELPAIYEQLDIKRECRWDRSAPGR
jgi:hypothetical protein